MLFRKIYYFIKRKFFNRLTGINPEEFRKMVECQKFFEIHKRIDND